MTANPHLLHEAEVVERVDELPSVFTLRLRFSDAVLQRSYRFAPGQFNMLYLFGVGEVPISIVSDPEDDTLLDHTIRAVGRVTNGLARLQAGDRIGIRGPYGRGWPLERARGRDVCIITGGLGCAPSVSVIHYIMKRRSEFGRLTIMQGVKHVNDMIWRQRYEQWAQQPDTQVLLAADHGGPVWPWHEGPVTELFDHAQLQCDNVIVMMCGPEGMMNASVSALTPCGVPDHAVWLSMERSMQCALGHCGHCQFGPKFVCRDGPVFHYPDVKHMLGVRGI